MDCDDVSLPSRLEEQRSFLNENPEIGNLIQELGSSLEQSQEQE